MFTIAIPVFKLKKNFSHTLKSLEHLNLYLVKEIVFYIQPGEDTTKIIEQIDKSNIDAKYHVNSENIGMVRNWNQSIEKCTSKYLIIKHDDDILLPGVLKRFLKVFQDNPNTALIASKPGYATNRLKTIVKFFLNRLCRYSLYNYNDYEDFLLNAFPLTPSGVCFNIEVLENKFMFSNEFQYSADQELWPRILNKHQIIILKNWFVVKTKNGENFQLTTWMNDDFYVQYIDLHIIIYKYSSLNNKVFEILYNKLSLDLRYIANNGYISSDFNLLLLNEFSDRCKDIIINNYERNANELQ